MLRQLQYGPLWIFLFLIPLSSHSFDFRFAVPNPFESVHPAKIKIAQEAFLLPIVFEPLVAVDPNGDIKPVLMEKWEFNPSSQKLRLKIRQGVKFSDGTALDAKSIKQSFESICRLEYRQANHNFGLLGCRLQDKFPPKIDLIGPYEIEFSITVSPSTFFYQMAFGRFVIFKESSADTGIPIGSGDFTIQSVDSKSVILKRAKPIPPKKGIIFPDHIKLEYVKTSELEAALPQFDGALMILSHHARGALHPNFSLVTHAPYVTQFLVLNSKHPAFLSGDLRREILRVVKGIDFSKCMKGVIPAKGPVPDGIGGSLLENIPQPIANAKTLPQQGRFGKVTIFRHLDRQNLCEEDLIGKAVESLGLSFSVTHISDYASLKKAVSDPSSAGFIELFAFGARDPSNFFRHLLPENIRPYFYYTDQESAKRLHQAWLSDRLSDRFAAYREISKSMMMTGAVIPLYHIGNWNLFHRCLTYEDANQDIIQNPNSMLMLRGLGKKEKCER